MASKLVSSFLFLFLLMTTPLIYCRPSSNSVPPPVGIISTSRCREKGDVAFSDTCYRFVESTEPVSYDSASDYCRQIAGNKTLALITSKREQLFLANYLETRGWPDALIGLRLVKTPWRWVSQLGDDDDEDEEQESGNKSSKKPGASPNQTFQASLLNGQGCFGNSKIDASNSKYSSRLTVQGCVKFCHEKGRQFAGVQAATLCLCADQLPPPTEAAYNCTMKCSGDGNQFCGNHRSIYFYTAGPDERSPFSDNWANSRPGGDGNCAASLIVDRQHSGWYDVSCTTPLPFICHFDRQAIARRYYRRRREHNEAVEENDFLNWPTGAVISSTTEKGFCTPSYCYLLFPRIHLNFAAANKFCSKRGRGGRLVRIDSTDEQVIINQLVLSPPNRGEKPLTNAPFRFWIGATRLEFQWGNGRPLRPGFAAWAEDAEPSFNRQFSCVRMSSYEGAYMWRVRVCDDLVGSKTFICSGPAKPSESLWSLVPSRNERISYETPEPETSLVSETKTTLAVAKSTKISTKVTRTTTAASTTVTASTTIPLTTTPEPAKTTTEAPITSQPSPTKGNISAIQNEDIFKPILKTTLSYRKFNMEPAALSSTVKRTTVGITTEVPSTTTIPEASTTVPVTTLEPSTTLASASTLPPSTMTTEAPITSSPKRLIDVHFKRKLDEMVLVVFNEASSPSSSSTSGPISTTTTAGTTTTARWVTTFGPQVMLLSRNFRRQTAAMMTTLLAGPVSTTFHSPPGETSFPTTAAVSQVRQYSKPILVSLSSHLNLRTVTPARPIQTTFVTTTARLRKTPGTATRRPSTTVAMTTKSTITTPPPTTKTTTTKIVTSSPVPTTKTTTQMSTTVVATTEAAKTTETTAKPTTVLLDSDYESTSPVVSSSSPVTMTTTTLAPTTLAETTTLSPSSSTTSTSRIIPSGTPVPLTVKHAVMKHIDVGPVHPAIEDVIDDNNATNASTTITINTLNTTTVLILTESDVNGTSVLIPGAAEPDTEDDVVAAPEQPQLENPFIGNVAFAPNFQRDEQPRQIGGAGVELIFRPDLMALGTTGAYDSQNNSNNSGGGFTILWWHVLIAVLFSVGFVSVAFPICYCYSDSIKLCLRKRKRDRRRISPSSSAGTSHHVTPAISSRDDDGINSSSPLPIDHHNFTSINCAALKRIFQPRASTNLTLGPQREPLAPGGAEAEQLPSSTIGTGRRSSAPYRVWPPSGNSRVGPISTAVSTLEDAIKQADVDNRPKSVIQPTTEPSSNVAKAAAITPQQEQAAEMFANKLVDQVVKHLGGEDQSKREDTKINEVPPDPGSSRKSATETQQEQENLTSSSNKFLLQVINGESQQPSTTGQGQSGVEAVAILGNSKPPTPRVADDQEQAVLRQKTRVLNNSEQVSSPSRLGSLSSPRQLLPQENTPVINKDSARDRDKTKSLQSQTPDSTNTTTSLPQPPTAGSTLEPTPPLPSSPPSEAVPLTSSSPSSNSTQPPNTETINKDDTINRPLVPDSNTNSLLPLNV